MILKTFITICILLSFAVLENMFQFGYGVNDAFWRVVWSIDEGTVWADNFSEEKFNQVEVGMTQKEVLLLLGRPLNKIHEHKAGHFWYYTRQDTGTSDFDQRWVVFDSNATVEEVRKSFYID